MSKLYHSPVDIKAGRILLVETGAVRCRRRRRLTCCIVLKTMRESCTITRARQRNARDVVTRLESREGSNYFMMKYASRRSNLCSATRASSSAVNFCNTRKKLFAVKKESTFFSTHLRFLQIFFLTIRYYFLHAGIMKLNCTREYKS